MVEEENKMRDERKGGGEDDRRGEGRERVRRLP